MWQRGGCVLRHASSSCRACSMSGGIADELSGFINRSSLPLSGRPTDIIRIDQVKLSSLAANSQLFADRRIVLRGYESSQQACRVCVAPRSISPFRSRETHAESRSCNRQNRFHVFRCSGNRRVPRRGCGCSTSQGRSAPARAPETTTHH
jgi:hypothetical protein